MSYKIEIVGHTRNNHNAQVKEIAEEAWAKVRALHEADETTPTLSGYSGDQTGSITLATPTEVQKSYGEGPTEADTAANEAAENAKKES